MPDRREDSVATLKALPLPRNPLPTAGLHLLKTPEQERHLGTMGLNTGVHTGHFTPNHHGPCLRTHQPMIISSTQVCSRRIQKSDSSPMYRMSGSQRHPGADQQFQGGEIELVKTRNCHHIIRVSDWEF